jgi:hypothetical protein
MFEMYARSYCTENEHYLLQDELIKYCSENEIKLIYYRKLKNGHRPCWREWKVAGQRGAVLKLAEVFKDEIDNEWRC